jgi:hypothetical protein
MIFPFRKNSYPSPISLSSACLPVDRGRGEDEGPLVKEINTFGLNPLQRDKVFSGDKIEFNEDMNFRRNTLEP